jgi:O-antigen/teichoic acid export membrane protein
MTRELNIISDKGSRLPSPRWMLTVSLANLWFFGMHSVLFLVFTPWLLKVLGEELYGFWSILAAIVGFASLGNFSLGSALVKYVAEFHISENSRDSLSAAILFGFVSLLLLGSFVGMVVFILGGRIVDWFSSVPTSPTDLITAIRVVAISIVPLFITQVPIGVFAGLVRYEVSGVISIIQQAMLLIGSLIIGYYARGIVNLALWYLFVQVLICMLSLFIAWRIIRPFQLHLVMDRRISRRLIEYSFASWIANLGGMLFGSADRILVGIFLGPSAASVYSVATGAAMKLNQLLGPITDVLMPFSSSYQALGKDDSLSFALSYGSRVAACLLVGAAGTLILWAEPLLSWWISPEFAIRYADHLRALFICYAIFSMDATAYQMSRGLGVMLVPAIITISSALLVLFLISILSPKYGLMGAVMANFGYTLVLGINFHVATKLALNPRTAVLRPLGPPLIVLLLLTPISFLFNMSAGLKVVTTVILLSILGWMVIRPEGFRVLVARALNAKREKEFC